MPKKDIELLQGYYHFLTIGKFLEQYIQQHNLQKHVTDVKIDTGKQTHFLLQKEKTQRLLKEIYEHPGKPNVLGFMTELTAFRGIFSITRELIEQSSSAQNFFRNTLKEQYFPFEQLIRFIRNIMSHNIYADLRVQTEYYLKQKQYLNERDITRIHLKFTYAKFIPQRTGSKTYGVDIKVDFGTLRNGKKFKDIIDVHQLYLLAELCFNLSELFRSKK